MTDTDRGAPATPSGTPLQWLRGLFRLDDDADPEASVRRIQATVDFRGGTLWALVLAILVASVGLNVNSTAVIIGAMLISPLMGPIIGAGLGIAINDLELLKRAVRNVAIAAIVSVIASALYFAISPLSQAQSELLARTRPTLYDVLIAFFGGAAGIVAGTRKGDGGTVVPGVAIATALMPPLCTAGFGLATRNWGFLFGALYLFLINSVFICLATVLVVRLLRFPRVHDLDPERERRVRWAMAVAVLITAVPSSYAAWQVVRETIFLSAAQRYVAENFAFPDRSLIAKDLRFRRDTSTIDLTLVGAPLTSEMRGNLDRRLAEYGLAGTRLVVREPMAAGSQADKLNTQAREGILEDLYRKDQESLQARDTRIRLLEDEVVRLKSADVPVEPLAREVVALYPGLVRLGFGRSVSVAPKVPSDTTVAILTEWVRVPPAAEIDKLRAFLRARLALDTVDVVVRQAR